MPRFEVEMMLCREVTVEVEARSEKDAREAAMDRARWLRAKGLRSRLRLLTFMAVRRL